MTGRAACGHRTRPSPVVLKTIFLLAVNPVSNGIVLLSVAWSLAHRTELAESLIYTTRFLGRGNHYPDRFEVGGSARSPRPYYNVHRKHFNSPAFGIPRPPVQHYFYFKSPAAHQDA